MVKKVLLIDDLGIMKLVLNAIFKDDGHFELVAHAKSGDEVKNSLELYEPDIAIIDISLKSGDSIELCRYITSNYNTKTLVLTSFTDDEFMLEAAEAGASGYLLKDMGSKQLIRCLKEISLGRNLFDSRVSMRVGEILKKAF